MVAGPTPISRILMQLRGEVRPLRLGTSEPILCSANTAWAGIPFEVHRIETRQSVGETGPVDGEYGLMVVARGSYEATVRVAEGEFRLRVGPGAIGIVSGKRRPHVLSIEGSAEVVAMPLVPRWLQYLSIDPRKLEHRGMVAGGRTACTLAAALCEEVLSGCAAGRLYAESLSLSLLTYAFSRVPQAEPAEALGLSASERALIAGYIRDQLDQNISLSRLSRLVGLGPRQFSERFRTSFGTTPHRYLTQLRVNEGARLLAAGQLDIAEIALRVGFCSQSHFTTAFRRAFGVTPRRYVLDRRTIVALPQ